MATNPASSQWRTRPPSRLSFLESILPQRISSLFLQPHHHHHHHHHNLYPRPRPRHHHLLPTRSTLLILLLSTIPWILLTHHSERTTFTTHLSACHWDRWENWPPSSTPHHLILLADPQLVDAHTYPDRPWPISSLTIFYTDLYLARTFRELLKQLQPDTILFLGDLFDGGREWATLARKSQSPEKRFRGYGERYWLNEYSRFSKIFWKQWTHHISSLSSFTTSSIDDVGDRNGREGWVTGGKKKIVTTLPGNHDLGLGSLIPIPVRDRFLAFFGDGNRIDIFGNHTFVGIDAVSLSAKSQFAIQSPGKGGLNGGDGELEKVWKPTVEFLDDVEGVKKRVVGRELDRLFGGTGWQGGKRWKKSVGGLVRSKDELVVSRKDAGRGTGAGDKDGEFPTVLLTHIPLYRDPGTKCGPLREKWPSSSSSTSSTSKSSTSKSGSTSSKKKNGQKETEIKKEEWKGFDSSEEKDDRNAIAVRAGYQYQNVLTLEISEEVIHKIGNVGRVFSGDDHDYCDVLHRRYSSLPSSGGGKGGDGKELGMIGGMKGIREITVKSMSWAMGIRKPGFLLVSLWNPVDENGNSIPSGDGNEEKETMQTHLCLLPDQLSIFIRYGIMFGVTVLMVLTRSVWRVWSLKSRRKGKDVNEGEYGEDGDEEDDEEYRYLEKNGVDLPSAAVSRRPRRSTLQQTAQNGNTIGGYEDQLDRPQVVGLGLDLNYQPRGPAGYWHGRDVSKKERWSGRGPRQGLASLLPVSVSSSPFVVFFQDQVDGFVVPVILDTLGTLAPVAGMVGTWYLWLIWTG